MSNRRRGTPIDENVRLERALQEQEYRQKLETKLKGLEYRLFGDNNIMFDCVITERHNNFRDLSAYTYTMTCKLCQHVTERTQKTNLYLCSGCYREWIPETNTILKPSNQSRINRAKANGKLVLPCDEPTETILPPAKTVNKKAPSPKPLGGPKPLPPCENPAVKEVKMKIIELGPGQTFYHAETGILFIGKA